MYRPLPYKEKYNGSCGLMPCSGPIPPSQKFTEKVTKDVWEYIQKEYKVLNNPALYNNDNDLRNKCYDRLKKAIYSILEQDGFESW